jgi:hypothetical protein
MYDLWSVDRIFFGSRTRNNFSLCIMRTQVRNFRKSNLGLSVAFTE